MAIVENVNLDKVILTPCKVICLNSSYANPDILFGGCEDQTVKFWNLKRTGTLNMNLKENYEKQIQLLNGEIIDMILIEKTESMKNDENIYLIVVGIYLIIFFKNLLRNFI